MLFARLAYQSNFSFKEEKIKLSGTVPKGKLGEAIMAVSEIKPKKVENQLTEEK